ncbi:hypothetical protein GCM10007424_24790 [Flavobacterium suaedae]|uniref:Lipoprotein n=1 Tax=Flavobacterium suaedae TaxID=1767027 RepID=A0ABQ1K4J9_9FLAO|nr:hypothetical protein [Flavobacterium suaedae]GGB83812.1 hypothetical protein GCM10007424_24790 [Flavobacterium suaedae]
MKFKVHTALSILFILFLFSGCKQGSNQLENKIEKSYEVGYFNYNCIAKMVVFDNNDTIYLYTNQKNSKIKAEEATLSAIKKLVSDDLQPKSLLVKRPRFTDSGQLVLSIGCGNNKIKSTRHGVDNDIRVSENFSSLLRLLNKKHKNIYDQFIIK